MDTKRFPKTTRLPAFRLDLANKMRDLPRYDTVIVGDDNAFSFALAEQNDLFKGIPIVFLAVNNISKAVSQNNNPQVTWRCRGSIRRKHPEADETPLSCSR